MSTTRLALIGTGGHGRGHLAQGLRMHEEGTVRLVAVADPHPPAAEELPDGAARFSGGADLLATASADVVVICTPIHTHYELAAAALEAGMDVLLEKPTTATLDEFERLSGLAERSGRLVQVGFQSLGSGAIGLIRSRVAAGAIGEVVRYGATGAWVRADAYWSRSAWAGRRTLGGRVVADGVLTNPLAHATATALALAGATRTTDVHSLEVDLWHANDIEADDTSVAIFGLDSGLRLTTAVTLAAAAQTDPYVEVVGTEGAIRLWYTKDVVERRDLDGTVLDATTTDRADLLENLLAARAGAARLFAPIAETGAFMRLVDRVVDSPAPRRVAAETVSAVNDAAGHHLVISGIEEQLDLALRRERTFSELGSAFTVVS